MSQPLIFDLARFNSENQLSQILKIDIYFCNNVMKIHIFLKKLNYNFFHI